MEKSIELTLNSLKYSIMSSQEQEAEERRLIFAYLKQMMEFFDISGTPEIRRDMDEYRDSDGYYILFRPYLNDILFQKLNLKTFRYEFIEKIVGYSPGVGNFPIVKSIHDLYLVITAMYKRFVTICYKKENSKVLKETISSKDTKFSIIKVPSIISLNFNY